ncbi:MAG: hypothetical protein CTY36_00150 [Methylocystis sp.]|nr:MAG: hypothetical protein CTY36_00150 [Methylocystis sp.]
MDSSISKLIDQISEFIGRDLLYILGGNIFTIILLNALEIDTKELLANFDYGSSLLNFTAIAVWYAFSYAIGFVIREILQAPTYSFVTTRALDETKLDKDLAGNRRQLTRLFCMKLFRISNYAVSEATISIDTKLGFYKDRFRVFKMYQRALFLKEFCSTIGSNIILGLAAYWFIFLSIKHDFTYEDLGVAITTLALSYYFCRLSVYQAFRQGRFAREIEMLPDSYWKQFVEQQPAAQEHAAEAQKS